MPVSLCSSAFSHYNKIQRVWRLKEEDAFRFMVLGSAALKFWRLWVPCEYWIFKLLKQGSEQRAYTKARKQKGRHKGCLPTLPFEVSTSCPSYITPLKGSVVVPVSSTTLRTKPLTHEPLRDTYTNHCTLKLNFK